MIKNVVAMSRDRATRIKPASWSPRPTAIISIGNRNDAPVPLSTGFAKLLRTNFDHVDGAWRREGDNGPTAEQIREILDFIQALADDETTYDLIVHCREGKYRSATVAEFVYHHFDHAEVSVVEKDARLGRGSISLMRDLVTTYTD